MIESRGLAAILAVLIPFAGGCNSILGIKGHVLDPDAGGDTGSGGTAGGPACGVDGAVNDAEAAAGTTCGFIMPNPAGAGLPNPVSYTRNLAARTVTDNVTGLTWEAEVDPTTYPQAAAIMHCQNKAGGGWRLPSRIELVSLVDFTIAKPGPTISTAAFADDPVWTSTAASEDYRKFWTSSHGAFDAGTGWQINFADGSTHQTSGAGNYKARCVSGTPCRCPPNRYQVQASTPAGEEVYDGFTGLTWQRAVADTKMVWIDAAMYCPSGWRLPSLTELSTIVDETMELPAIDAVTFQGTPGEPFWTSSPQAGSTNGGSPPAFAWYVTFYHGHSDVYPSNDPASFKWWVRCVKQRPRRCATRLPARPELHASRSGSRQGDGDRRAF